MTDTLDAGDTGLGTQETREFCGNCMSSYFAMREAQGESAGLRDAILALQCGYRHALDTRGLWCFGGAVFGFVFACLLIWIGGRA